MDVCAGHTRVNTLIQVNIRKARQDRAKNRFLKKDVFNFLSLKLTNALAQIDTHHEHTRGTNHTPHFLAVIDSKKLLIATHTESSISDLKTDNKKAVVILSSMEMMGLT